MLNAPHLLETALLMLAAFLVGAVVGVVLRLLLARPKPAIAAVVEAKPAEAPAAPALVTAPEIAPFPVARPTAEQRLAAVAGIRAATEGGLQSAIKIPAHTLPSMPEIASILPSRTAGETVGGRHIDNPEHPQSASLDDVRAELQAQIGAVPIEVPVTSAQVEAPGPVVEATPPVAVASETAAAPAINEDATIVPAAMAEPDAPLPETSDALAAEAETPMLAEVSDAEAEDILPVEQRIEPAIVADPLPLMDAPRELATEIQDVIETPDADPVPDVVAEAPLVEPVYEKEAEEAAADRLFPVEDKVEPVAAPVPEDEMAAMRAIEGGWTPRRAVVTRRPADLPEGVSAAEVAAADRAVVQSGAAVANAAAIVSAVLEEAAPAKPARPPGGFGRPASLPGPRDGRKDDLGQIKGLGPAIESALNGLGIYHYDQVADWDQKAVVWVENHFGFKGRVGRERWQEQARDLSRGRMPVARPIRR
jgi:predicted flap endonuclease-1-like 5' DNA nuclease